MKTRTPGKNALLKLAKAVMIAVFIGPGFAANAQCSAGFTYVVNPANNGEVTFTNTSTVGTPYANYQWEFGDGGTDYTTSPTHTFNYNGTFNVILRIADSSFTCSDTVMHQVTVINTTPHCEAYFTHYDSLGYIYFANQSVVVGNEHYWDFGDGTTDSTSDYSVHHYATAGFYYACLTVTNSDHTCSNTYCDTINAATCHADFYFTADVTGFGGTFTSTSSGTADIYNWDFGDGNTGTGAVPHHVYAGPGYYNVHLMVSSSTDSTCGDTYYRNISIVDQCNASFTVVQDSIDTYHFDIYNYSTTGSSSINYFWDFGDGNTSTAAYPSHSYAGSGPYYLCLTITSDDSVCYATHCDSLIAGRSTTGISVTVLQPVSTGVQQIEKINTLLENYPNPFNGSTTINYVIAKNATVELTVMDLLGNKIATIESSQKQAGNYSVVWNAEDVAGGMYLLQMNVDNQLTTKKIIVSK